MFDNFKNYKYFNLIPIILITIILYKLIDNIDSLGWILSKSISISHYFIWGFFIAYLLNPLMVYIEKKLKTIRLITIIIVYSIFLSGISLFFILVIPEMVKSILDLLKNLPGFATSADYFINTKIMQNELFVKYGSSSYITDNITTIVGKLNSLLQSGFTVVFSQLINISSMLFNLITGIIISIYLLSDKESSIDYLKKFLYSFLKKSWAENIIKIGSKINVVFKQYVIGKSIDSLIIGVLCFIGLKIFNVHYALLISLIIGVTNLIPYFGNAIGLIPTILIALFAAPIDALKLFLIVSVLSLFDGWILGPKIIGEKVGLSPLWIIIAISIGGGLFGVLGMFLSVPLAAVVKTALQGYIDKKYKAVLEKH